MVMRNTEYEKGLSPLARGNLRGRRAVLAFVGPIPARAGQPEGVEVAAEVFGAYPRSRGATAACKVDQVIIKGLSPLARGNLPGGGITHRSKGPIPARAGQP